MPDVTVFVRNIKSEGGAERLERVLSRLDFVNLASVDGEKGLAAVSYEGAGAELGEIESAIEEAGFECEATPGASRLEGGE